MAVIQEAYIHGISTRAVDDPVRAMGLTGTSKSQVSRLTEHGDVEQVRRQNRRRPEPVPPGGDEGAPASALAVGGGHHLFQVAEEARDAGCLEHAAHDLRPALVGADGPGAMRLARGDPGLAQRQAGGHDAPAVRADPDHEIGVAEALALPWLFDIGVEPDAHEAAGHLVRELRVVAGRDPEAADRQPGHLGLPENTILPERRGERGGQRCGRSRRDGRSSPACQRWA